VRDAIKDPRTLANPLVAGEMGLRFYAAAPLVTNDGHRLGTFNIIDLSPRDLSLDELALLKDFAAIVMDQMELRLTARETIASLAKVFCESKDVDRLVTVCAWTKKIWIDGEWLGFDEFLTDRLGLPVSHGMHPDAFAAFEEDPEE